MCDNSVAGKGDSLKAQQPSNDEWAGQPKGCINSVQPDKSPLAATVKAPAVSFIKTVDEFHGPWGVTVSKSNEVIVTQLETGYVQFCSAEGNKFRLSSKTVGSPYGIALDCDNNILVVSFGHGRLMKFSQEGTLIAMIGAGRKKFKGPIGICLTVNGKVYVVDNLAHCVHILNSDLTFSSKFGSQGSGEGEFNYPRDIAVDSTGCLYVVDEVNHRVQVFTPNGAYLRQFGKKGSEPGELNLPVSICVDSDDRVYLGEDMNARISVFTREGSFIHSFGSKGSEPGQFDRPFGMAVNNGILYVCDYGNRRIQLFNAH